MINPQVILLTDTVLFGEVGNGRYMGAYVLASQLEQAGVRVLVVDYFTQHPDFFKFIEEFMTPNLLFVGVSSTFLAPFASSKIQRENRSKGIDLYYSGELWFHSGEELQEWTSTFKKMMLKKSPNSKLVLGGAKAQFAIWRSNNYKDFDLVCLGSADKTLVKLAKDLSSSSPVDKRQIQGTWVLDNAGDLEDKKCPTTRWTPSFRVQPRESLPIEIARGCVFNCKFCHYDKKESFKKDLDLLRDEFVFNYENYRTDTYHFCDDCFNDHPKKVEAVCNLIQQLPFKIEWTAYSRVDVASKFPESLTMMIESGARGLYFGIESFNHEVALRAGKGTPTEKVKSFLLEFKEKFSSRCLLEGSFIVGLPGETLQSQEETKNWVLANPVFDFFTIGPLGIMPYVSSFDKIVFDYAEYSRQPEKFGFKNINYQKRYWEHETFNSIQANEVASSIKQEWNQLHGFQKIKSIWLYPHLKSLGYRQSEIFSLARDKDYCANFDVKDLYKRFSDFKTRYWDDLSKQKGSY